MIGLIVVSLIIGGAVALAPVLMPSLPRALAALLFFALAGLSAMLVGSLAHDPVSGWATLAVIYVARHQIRAWRGH